jgi:hypothetical protein
MTGQDDARARKEATEAVLHDPPTASDAGRSSALQRYLGASLFTMLKRGRQRAADKRTAADEPPGPADQPPRHHRARKPPSTG